MERQGSSPICAEFYPEGVSQERLDMAFPGLGLEKAEKGIDMIRKKAPVAGLGLAAVGTGALLTGCNFAESVRSIHVTLPIGEAVKDCVDATIKGMAWFDARSVAEVSLGLGIPVAIIDQVSDELRRGRAPEVNKETRARGVIAGLFYRTAVFSTAFGALKIGWDLASAAMGHGTENHVLIANSKVDTTSGIIGFVTIAWKLLYASAKNALEHIVSIE